MVAVVVAEVITSVVFVAIAAAAEVAAVGFRCEMVGADFRFWNHPAEIVMPDLVTIVSCNSTRQTLHSESKMPAPKSSGAVAVRQTFGEAVDSLCATDFSPATSAPPAAPLA